MKHCYRIREAKTDMHGNHHEISFTRACAERAKRPRTWRQMAFVALLLVGAYVTIWGLR